MEQASALSPEQAHAERRAGRLRLIDIRRPDEWLLGSPEGAERIGIDDLLDEGARPSSARTSLALICEAGGRSCAGAERLRAAGIDARDVAGGLRAWRAAGLPIEWPESPLSPTERERYRRHIALPGFGVRGQLALKASSVLLVGCGGLGSPAALYLAAAGVGALTLVDDDAVERSNLQRQVLHDERAIGQAKVDSARSRLAALNPDIRVETHALRLDEALAVDLAERHDLVVDGSDNFATRDAVNSACVRTRTPMVYGAVERFSGHVGLFRPGVDGEPCYRCLFGPSTGSEVALSCAEAGVLGVLPGVIGSMQALEAIRWLSAEHRDRVPTGWVAVFDGAANEWRKIRVPRDPGCPVCATSGRRGS